jgi:predicted signal transduction protein with EAL and GGDEF domain
MGDELLKRTAGLLTQVVRKSDEVARLGGDEFTVTLPYSDQGGDPARVADRLVRSFVNLSTESANVGTGLSVGIAVFPEDGSDVVTLLQNADRAMYAAKNDGGNRYHFFSAAMEQDSVRRLKLESDIAAAVGTTQLYLEYQPQIDALADNIRGVEALLRWKHPTSGLVSPDRFVSIAEKNGCIVPIGRWALAESCRQMRKWVERGLGEMRLAVNVSARQLRHPSFVDVVSDALKSAAFPPDHLELEITESTFVSPNLDATRIFGELKELGVSISIDDFGTGYSTFDALRRLPVDGLKIDRSFLTDGLESEKNAKIVEAIVAMGATLGITVVAEGVETKAEVDFLKWCRCRIMQGFYFAHPMSARELGRMAAEPARWAKR